MAEYVLTLSCPDRVGIVHAVAAYLHEAGCNVLDSQQFADRTVKGSSRFFMRVHVETLPPAHASAAGLHSGFTSVAAASTSRWWPAMVLARYMRILSPDLCAKMAGRIINIHHSFLPSFKGAQPYQQAHAHGVKLIGATAHYVTADLDEGPIIEQEVARVDHTSSPL